MNLDRIGIVRSFVAVFLLVGLALAATVTISWTQLASVVSETDDAGNRVVPQLVRMAQTELNVTRVSLQLRHAMLVRTPQELQATLDDIGRRRTEIDADLKAFEQHVSSTKGKDLLKVVLQTHAAFWTAGEANLAMIQAGKKDAAFDHLVGTLIPTRNQLLKAIADERAAQQELLAGLVQSAESDAHRAQLLVLGLAVAVLLVLGTGVWVVAASVRRRVGSATAVLGRVAQGDLTLAVQDTGTDEFQPMMAQLEAMQGFLRDMVGQLQGATENIGQASSEVASGNADLSHRTEQTASNLQQASSSLQQLTANVRQSADAAAQDMGSSSASPS